MDERAAALLHFWFGDAPHSAAEAERRSALWFAQDDAVDAEIRQRFGALPALAARSELEGWRDSPRSALALVLVLDQLPRNLHRRSGEAFAYDAQALGVALAAIDDGTDDLLHPIEASFLYLPLEHAEDRGHQARSVSLFEALLKRAPIGQEKLFRRFLEFARRHQSVIERFGRFPHRNAVLGRESTAEERAYLAAGGDRFGG